MKTILWLDDVRDPLLPQWRKFIRENVEGFDELSCDIVWVKGVDEFHHRIEQSITGHLQWPYAICFDHDLGDIITQGAQYCYSDMVERTGYTCAKWLCNFCTDHHKPLPKYAIQSSNGPGAENIRCYLENYKKYVENAV